MGLPELLAAQPGLFTVGLTLLGLIVGSFLNVVIHRLPQMMDRDWRRQCAELAGQAPAKEAPRYDLLTPRSQCPHCGHRIGALENIPVISYMVLRGRCRACDAAIGLRYPAVEVLGALVALAAAWHYGPGAEAFAAAVFGWSLIAAAGIDLDHQLLPDSIILPVLWLGLACNLFGLFTDLGSSVAGAMAGYLSLWLVYHGFRLLTGKEGMGYGDFKLFALLGAWMGWQSLPLVIILASLVGAVVGIALMTGGRLGQGKPIPFGPFLAVAGWIGLLWGEQITGAYLRWSMPGL